MADMLESLAGNKMLMLKQEIVALRQRLAEVQDEDAKKAIRGDFGNGAERRRQLGNDYEQVQALVNKMYRDGNLNW